MTTFTEGDLQIEFQNVINARKFDGPDHDLSHCMKAVDFVVELADRYLFIEIKDPQDPQVPVQGLNSFVKNFQSGRIDEDFKYKYRDSFLYEWAAGRADKPVYYLVLIALDTLTAPDLSAKLDDLKRKLPLQGPKSNLWVRPIVSGCGVFNIALWNRIYSDYTVTRLSANEQP